MTPDIYTTAGFPPVQLVATLRSIAHLFPSNKKGGRCGIYLLVFQDGTHYIGQAIDVVRRFAQHRLRFDIVGFSFIRTPAKKLDELERDKIYLAESVGLRLVNFIHTTVVAGETDLDLLLPEEEQQKWIGAGAYHFERDQAEPIRLSQTHLDRYAERIKRFHAHPQSALAAHLLRTYLINCIPAPRRTEYSFWNVSCLPATGRGTFERLLCVSAASMELFVLLCDKKNKDDIWGFLTVSDEALTSRVPDPEEFRKRHTSVDFTVHPYRDAGEDQITLWVSGATALKQLLEDEDVQFAGGILAQRVMRKRPTFYAQYHCPQLAQLALG